MERHTSLFNKLSHNIKKISPSVRVLDRASEIADFVLEKEAKYATKSNLELKNISYRMMDEVAAGIPLDNFLVDGLAIAREMIYRIHGQKAYRVQIIGAIVAHFGDFAEMRTGEGKTLTLLLVSYVNALSRKGVHIVTVNEYLVKRDMEYSQAALGELGVTVGCITADMRPADKKRMYSCDITYVSNSELGFDYLRDNMVSDFDKKMQRPLNYAIVDEADSILIDEARTPLIIAGNPLDSVGLYAEADKFVKSLVPNDYVIDLESHAINLNDNGIKKSEAYFQIKNLYDIENSPIVHKMMNALRANYIMEIGKEYIVRHNKMENRNEIALVDSFTGRIMEGRMYSAGLHQAIQAKEHVKIEPENVTLATITYQSLFRLYRKLAGLSGTAMTERQEFLDIYNMVVVEIPTNMPMIRVDQPDYVFGNKQLKWKYVAAEIKRRHAIGQPILVGTVSVEDSELLHRLLNHLGIKHNILNAKNHAIEAEIIKQAGFKYAVTIATNMAGRGTDIKLGPGVRELGGLYVIGTERNESRRIDNQLRGRSGRQGDLGESRFFISLQDSLFKRFASDRFDKAQFKMGEEVIDLKFFSRLLDKTQMRVENINYDVRKNLIDYDYVLSEQRQLIYKQRDAILQDKNLLITIYKMIPRVMDVLIILNRDEQNVNVVHIESLLDDVKVKLGITLNINIDSIRNLHNSDIFKFLCIEIRKFLTTLYSTGDQEHNNKVWRSLLLQALDNNWTKFLDKIQKLRDGVSLRSYEQRSPLNIYVEDSDRLFYNTTINIAEEAINAISKLNPTDAEFQSSVDASELRFFDNMNLAPNNTDLMKTTTIDDLDLSLPLKQNQLADEQTVSEITQNDLQTPAKPRQSVVDVVDQIWKQMHPDTKVNVVETNVNAIVNEIIKDPRTTITPHKNPNENNQLNLQIKNQAPEFDNLGTPAQPVDPKAPLIHKVTNDEHEVVNFGHDAPAIPTANVTASTSAINSNVDAIVNEIISRNAQPATPDVPPPVIPKEVKTVAPPIPSPQKIAVPPAIPKAPEIPKAVTVKPTSPKSPPTIITTNQQHTNFVNEVSDPITKPVSHIAPVVESPKKRKSAPKKKRKAKPVAKPQPKVMVADEVAKPVDKQKTVTESNKLIPKAKPHKLAPTKSSEVEKSNPSKGKIAQIGTSEVDDAFYNQVLQAVDNVNDENPDFSEIKKFFVEFKDDLDNIDTVEKAQASVLLENKATDASAEKKQGLRSLIPVKRKPKMIEDNKPNTVDKLKEKFSKITRKDPKSK